MVVLRGHISPSLCSWSQCEGTRKTLRQGYEGTFSLYLGFMLISLCFTSFIVSTILWSHTHVLARYRCSFLLGWQWIGRRCFLVSSAIHSQNCSSVIENGNNNVLELSNVLIWRSSPIILSLSVTVLMTVTLSVTALLIVSRFKSQVLKRQERQPGILVFPLTFQTCHCHSNQSLRVSPSHTNQIAILNWLIILISSSISIIRVLAVVELNIRTRKDPACFRRRSKAYNIRL